LRLFTMASRMPQDWTKSPRLPIVFNMWGKNRDKLKPIPPDLANS
jgi:hypothetical protein